MAQEQHLLWKMDGFWPARSSSPNCRHSPYGMLSKYSMRLGRRTTLRCELHVSIIPEIESRLLTKTFAAFRYQHLDQAKKKLQEVQAKTGDLDERLQAKLDIFLNGDTDFIHKNDIKKVWKEYVAKYQNKDVNVTN